MTSPALSPLVDPSLVDPSLVDPSTGAGPAARFSGLGLPLALVRELTAQGLTTAFPVQAATIPDGLAGRDLLGRGRTGSGKTLAFGLPLLARTAQHAPARARSRRPHALVLAPTRELALQVTDALRPYARALDLWLAPVVGGSSYERQIRALERGVHLVVATPGRLIDLVERGVCDLSDVRVAVLDEADQMADVGFLPEVCALLDMVDPTGQRMLFSATLDDRVRAVVDRYLVDPVEHSTDPAEASVPDMSHHVLSVAPKDKARVVAEIATRAGRTLMFTRSRLGAEAVAARLGQAGLRAQALHGGMAQGQRNRTLDDFKRGWTPVLVATDVAARGIHVDDIDLVLHIDPANDHRDYLHRAGRTARAGQSGTVVTLALPHQVASVRRMLRTAGVPTEAVTARPGSAVLADLAGARDPQVATAEGVRLDQQRRTEQRAARRERPAYGDGRRGTDRWTSADRRGTGDQRVTGDRRGSGDRRGQRQQPRRDRPAA